MMIDNVSVYSKYIINVYCTCTYVWDMGVCECECVWYRFIYGLSKFRSGCVRVCDFQLQYVIYQKPKFICSLDRKMKKNRFI